MGIQAQLNTKKIERVLLTKIKHSKYTGGGEGEDTHFEDLSFKFLRCKNKKSTYFGEFLPVLYYEWSKRQNQYHSTMFLSCVFVTNYIIFKNLNLDFFDSNSTDTLKRLKTIDKMFLKFYFEDVKVYFFIEHPLNASPWSKMDIKKFLFEQKEDDINCQIEELKRTSGRRFKLHDDDIRNEQIDFLEKQITEKNSTIHKLRDDIQRISGENYHLRYEIEKRGNPTNAGDSFKYENCVICFNEKPNILFCDCGHLCTCEECDKLLTNSKCPICRKVNTIKRKI